MAEEANEPKISELAGVPAPKTTKSSSGWMITAIICALGFLGTGGYTIYNLVSGNNGVQKDTSEGSGTANCDIKDEVSGTDNIDTGAIAKTQSGDYVVNFLKSGLKLNLGSNFTLVNYSYSAMTPSSNASETVILGGLSENTWGYQNMPEYVYGEAPSPDTSLNEGYDYWRPFLIIRVHQKSWWDAQGMDTKYAEAEANGVAPTMPVVYRDDNYVVTINHPQNTVAPEGWQRDWEYASIMAFKNAAMDSNNWSY